MPIMTQATEASIATKVTMAQVNADAQLSGTDQVTGLDTALTSKADADGTNATGTWPVSITGNAATATTANSADNLTGDIPISQVTGLQTALDNKLNAIENFITQSSPTFVNFTTFLNGFIYCSNPITLSIVDPSDTTIPVGWKCKVFAGNGAVTINNNSNPGTVIVVAQNQTASLTTYDLAQVEKIAETGGVSTYLVSGVDHSSGSNPAIVTVTGDYTVPESLNGGLIRAAVGPGNLNITLNPTLSANFRVKIMRVGNGGAVNILTPSSILLGNINSLTQSLAAVDVFKTAEFQFDLVMSQLKAGDNVSIGNDGSISVTGDPNPTPSTLVERGASGEINGVDINATGAGTLSAESLTANTVAVVDSSKKIISSLINKDDLDYLASANDGILPNTLVLRDINGNFQNSGYSPPVEITGTSLTLDPSYVNNSINFTSTSNVTVTLPTNGAQPIPSGSFFYLHYIAAGSSTLTLSAPGGVSIVGGAVSVGSGGFMILRKLSTNIWQVVYVREDVSSTVTTVGAIAGSLTMNFRRINKTIDFSIDNFTGTSTSDSQITAQIPQSRFFPQVQWRGLLIGLQNSISSQIYTNISTTGLITFGLDIQNTNFPSGQGVTFYAGGITYRIALG